MVMKYTELQNNAECMLKKSGKRKPRTCENGKMSH